MTLVDRVKNILVTPKTEWSLIAVEPAAAGPIISGYVVPLAAASAVAGLIGALIVGAAVSALVGGLGTGVIGAFIGACISVVFSIIGVFILSFIINILAPSFGAQKDSVQSLKVAAYSLTAVWVAGLAQVVPFLGTLVVLIGGLYGIFLMYLGLPSVMKAPEDKVPLYTVVIVVTMIVAGSSRPGDAGQRPGGQRDRQDASRVAIVVRSRQPPREARRARREARGEREEDGGCRKERRCQRSGVCRARRPRHAVRRRKAGRPGWRGSAQAVRARDVRRPAEDEQQRREDRHCQHHGVAGAGELQRRRAEARHARDLGHRSARTR
jgi:hypothetical protein